MSIAEAQNIWASPSSNARHQRLPRPRVLSPRVALPPMTGRQAMLTLLTPGRDRRTRRQWRGMWLLLLPASLHSSPAWHCSRGASFSSYSPGQVLVVLIPRPSCQVILLSSTILSLKMERKISSINFFFQSHKLSPLRTTKTSKKRGQFCASLFSLQCKFLRHCTPKYPVKFKILNQDPICDTSLDSLVPVVPLISWQSLC